MLNVDQSDYEFLPISPGSSSRVTRIDLKTDNLDKVSIPGKIVATFDVEHPIHGTTYGPK